MRAVRFLHGCAEFTSIFQECCQYRFNILSIFEVPLSLSGPGFPVVACITGCAHDVDWHVTQVALRIRGEWHDWLSI